MRVELPDDRRGDLSIERLSYAAGDAGNGVRRSAHRDGPSDGILPPVAADDAADGRLGDEP